MKFLYRRDSFNLSECSKWHVDLNDADFHKRCLIEHSMFVRRKLTNLLGFLEGSFVQGFVLRGGVWLRLG